MVVCASCGKEFDEHRYQVMIPGIRGAFDTIDCAEREWRRRLSRQRMREVLGDEVAARLLHADTTEGRGRAQPSGPATDAVPAELTNGAALGEPFPWADRPSSE